MLAKEEAYAVAQVLSARRYDPWNYSTIKISQKADAQPSPGARAALHSDNLIAN